MHPGLDATDLADLAEAIAARMPVETRWYLQPFVAAPGVDPDLAAGEAMDADALVVIAEDLRRLVPGVRVRGQED